MHVHVAIIGLDRLSASIGLALKRYQNQSRSNHTFTIIGSDPQAQPMKTAQQLGAVDDFQRAPGKAVDKANLVVINAPHSERPDLYARLGQNFKPGVVVLDLAEIKQPVIDLAAAHFPTNAKGERVAYLVGMTPIINVDALYSGILGVEGARADLFDNSDIILTPDTHCPGEAIALAEDMVGLLGARSRFMDPREHDGLVAATEQLPALLGNALFYSLQQSDGWDDIRRMVNPTLALSIHTLGRRGYADELELFTHNRANLARHLDNLITVLKDVRGMLSDPASAALLEAFLVRTHGEWEKWDVKRHSGRWDESTSTEPLPGPFGTLGGLLGMGRRSPKEDDDNGR